jgi:hypothetical protein
VNEIAENASTTLLFTTTSFRMLNFYWNRTRYVNLIKALHENVTNLQKYGDRKVKQIIIESVKYMQVLTTVFWISALITGNMMCIKSAIEAVIYNFRRATQESQDDMVRAYKTFRFYVWAAFDWGN